MAETKTEKTEAEAKAPAKEKPMEVVATAKGYYGRIRRPGDRFTISGQSAFSKKWMEEAKPEPKGEEKASK